MSWQVEALCWAGSCVLGAMDITKFSLYCQMPNLDWFAWPLISLHPGYIFAIAIFIPQDKLHQSWSLHPLWSTVSQHLEQYLIHSRCSIICCSTIFVLLNHLLCWKFFGWMDHNICIFKVLQLLLEHDWCSKTLAKHIKKKKNKWINKRISKWINKIRIGI